MGLQIWLAATGFKAIAEFERYTVPVPSACSSP